MFTWRLKHESLAFRTNLERRGIKVESTKCLFCSSADEDDTHLFIKCKAVKAVWRALELEKVRGELEGIRSVHAMLDYLWGLDENLRVKILTMWWHWWNNWNKLREGESPVPADEVTRRVLCNSMEYLQLFKSKTSKKEELKWQPPRDGMLKANFDGAYRPGEAFVTWGVIIQDEVEDVVTAPVGRTEHVTDPFGAKVTTMTEAIDMAADLGAFRMVFETDSKLLQESLDLTKVDSSPYAAIIEDSKF
ncbi:uncharacterized protein [Aegilops tauschii subsp. strangulata]|uniref:uncharacterized protein n=1 Tax=Aegilops tauschii subsp. strangulata TaxID=200361 RepID=UPI003CC8D4CA